MIKLNLGCGQNRLDGWQNHDAEVDISKPLPWGANHADFILCEHCVEHIPQYSAIAFFAECHRILKRGGVARIIVPSVVQVWKRSTPEYLQFVRKWVQIAGPEPTFRDAMANIIYMHGHQSVWSASLLEALLAYAGFDDVTPAGPGYSSRPELRGVDGHARAIGEDFNEIESCVMEATK